jgi:4-amino-4-deoxy-L-arabinose transferase-like glycosyltransferase
VSLWEGAAVSAAVTPPVSPAAEQLTAGGTRPRRRWEVWRSPAGQPGWARPALLAVAALAAVLYAWNIASVDFAPYYSVAVKSMSESWKALFYGAFDPAATITIDKLAGAFVPQALSARVFGFYPWALALPQVVEGVVTVLVMYRAVRRWAGEVPGLLAALLLTLTPIAASVFGHPMEDGALTMCLVLAADAWQRAVETGRLRSLVLSGVWVGLGFQAKMLQAWMILPALFIGYLVAVPWPGSGEMTPEVPSWDLTEEQALASGPRLVTRLWQLAVAGIVMLGVSLSWVLMITLTPAADRPYVDGSTDNSVIAAVFGYNGVERFGISFRGAVASGPGISAGSEPGGSSNPFGLPTGVFKLLSGWYGPQAGWLYPLAGLGLVAGLYLTRWARRGNPVRCALLMWGIWLCTAGLVFSVMTTIPHTAYLAMLAPPVAALAAAGIYMLVLVYRAGRPSGWLLPVAVVVEVLWADFLWRSYRGFLPWALTAAGVAAVVAAALLVTARLVRRFPRRVADVALGLGIAAMLAAPATWTASVLDVKYAGTSFDASAGPPQGHGLFSALRGPVLGEAFGSTQTLTPQTQAIYDYVSSHRDGATYLLAVPSWTEASRFIMASGQEAMPLGGFSGTVRTPTLARVQYLVRTGQLRFFWFGWFGGVGTGGADLESGTVGAIVSWVRGSCTQVPAAAYGNPPDDFGGAFGGATLYECTSAPNP